MLNFENIESLENEIWKEVEGYEGIYYVSNLGRVHNKRKIMKTYVINSGYLCIDLTVNKRKTKNLVHRLVAKAFVENNNSYTEVNHINEDKKDNRAENLEWCTSSLNKRHSIKSGTYDKIFTARNTLGKKHLPSPTSQYHNVSYDKPRQKWRGCIRHNGKNLESKRFDTEVEAAIHVNNLIDKYGLHDRTRNIIK